MTEYTDDVEVIPPASEQAQAHQIWRDYVQRRLDEMGAESKRAADKTEGAA